MSHLHKDLQPIWHQSDATWVTWQFQSLATPIFIKQLFQVHNKDNIKAEHYWPFVRRIQRWSMKCHHKASVMQKVYLCLNLIKTLKWNLIMFNMQVKTQTGNEYVRALGRVWVYLSSDGRHEMFWCQRQRLSWIETKCPTQRSFYTTGKTTTNGFDESFHLKSITATAWFIE